MEWETAGALLADGRVLFVICCTAEQVYDPASGMFDFMCAMTRVYQDGFASALPATGSFWLREVMWKKGVSSAPAHVYTIPPLGPSPPPET